MQCWKFQDLNNRNPASFNPSLILRPKHPAELCPARIPLKFIVFSQPPGLREVLARGEEQKREVQEAKGLKSLAQENGATTPRITEGGLSADFANRPLGLKRSFLKWLRSAPSSRGGNRKKEPGRQRPNALLSGCPS